MPRHSATAQSSAIFQAERHRLAAMLLRNLAITRCNWKAPIALPTATRRKTGRLPRPRDRPAAQAALPEARALGPRRCFIRCVAAPRAASRRRAARDHGLRCRTSERVGRGRRRGDGRGAAFIYAVYGGGVYTGARGRCSTTARRPTAISGMLTWPRSPRASPRPNRPLIS